MNVEEQAFGRRGETGLMAEKDAKADGSREASPDAEARRWIVRLASGSASDTELAALRAWRDADARHDAAFRRERQGWQDLRVIEASFANPVTYASATARRPRRSWPRVAGLAVAAALAALIAVPRVSLWWQADHVSPHATIGQVTLADGSRAVLDGDSAISVDFDDGQRLVRLLKGRAWFEVRHDDARPFRVAADNGVTQDIGTAFEVDRTGAQVRVGVTEGAVRVAGQDGQGVTLRAGEQAGYAAGGPPVRLAAADPSAIAGWRNGELLLRAVPVEDAVAAVARYRSSPVFVWGDLSAAAPVSGSFRTDQPEDALATLVSMRRLERMDLPGGVVILRAGSPTE